MLRNRQAADQFEALARRLDQQGNEFAAEAAYQSAAEIDLADDELQASWGGPLNGQTVRQRMFEELLDAIGFEAVIETGTFRGTTTEWIAQRFPKPILTCEINKRYFLQAKQRLGKLPQVRVELADSTDFLSRLKEEFARDAPLLFYLDAHWLDRLPLGEEVAIIRDQFPRGVVVIDDFEVPLDRGFTFDNYGPGRRIDLNLLARFREGATVLLPAGSSRDETGAKRGVCVLAWDREVVESLGRVPTLRTADDRDWAAAKLTTELETATAPAGSIAGIAAHVVSEVNKTSDQVSAEVRRVVDQISSELDRSASNTTTAVEERVKTLFIGITGAVANAILSPTPPGGDVQQDAGWGPFLTEIRKAIAPIRIALIENRSSDSVQACAAGSSAEVIAELEAARTLGMVGAVANAILSPTPPGTNIGEDERWGSFLTEVRKAVAPLRSVLHSQGELEAIVGNVLASRAGQIADAVDDRVKDVAVSVAGAAANALLSPDQPGTDPVDNERWGPFLTEIRKALAPLRNSGIQPLMARLDQATTNEIGLRSDLVRMEYRAIVAEKEARQAEERFVKKEERRSHDESLLRQVIADSEPQLEHLRSENARLHGLVNQIREEEVNATTESHRLHEIVLESQEKESKLKEMLSSIAESRWIKVGTRLGLSKLNRHLNDHSS